MAVQSSGALVQSTGSVPNLNVIPINSTWPHEFVIKFFNRLPLIDLCRYQSVCKNWSQLIFPIVNPRLKDNFSRIHPVQTFWKSRVHANPYVDARVFIEIAKVMVCFDKRKAKALLVGAEKLEAMMSPSCKIDFSVMRLKLEACIDMKAALLELKLMKLQSLRLSALLKAYAGVKIAEIEVHFGLEGACDSLQHSKVFFLLTAQEEKNRIIRSPHWYDYKSKSLIDLAWLETLVSLPMAKKTMQTAVRSAIAEGGSSVKVTSCLMYAAGGGGIDHQQRKVVLALIYAGAKVTLPEPASSQPGSLKKGPTELVKHPGVRQSRVHLKDAMEADLSSLEVQPITMENLDAVKSKTLSAESSMKKSLQLIEIARHEASFDVNQARGTLAQVEEMLYLIDDTAFTIIALVKQILRT